MSQVNKKSVDEIVPILRERFEKLVEVLTAPGVDDSVYEIKETRMTLAISDLKNSLKLLRVG